MSLLANLQIKEVFGSDVSFRAWGRSNCERLVPWGEQASELQVVSVNQLVVTLAEIGCRLRYYLLVEIARPVSLPICSAVLIFTTSFFLICAQTLHLRESNSLFIIVGLYVMVGLQILL